MIRTRFAPSPTGYLHIGGLRTALYAYLYAKKNNGEFFLRIEDTDQERLVEDSLQNIIDTLNWAGLHYDEGPGKPGKHGPFIQSQRLDLYQEHANKLLSEGHAYRCFCTRDRLEQMRNDQMAAKKAPMYDRKCRYLTPEEIQEKLNNKETFVVRQAVPLNKFVKFTDLVRGKMTFDTNTLDDHVLLKTDGFPTYHLAVVIDDHFMEITDVIRGEEWLPSTPKHILLYESFGWTPTTFAHLPLLLNKDRSKLSKRQNDVSTQSYIDKGYQKEALLNFIALLGWNTSDNNEIYSLEELQKEFSLERVQKGGAVFDLDKLNWFNWQWKRRKHLATLKEFAHQLDSNVKEHEVKKGEVKFKFSDQSNQDKFTKFTGEILLQYIEDHLNDDLKQKIKIDSNFSAKVLKSIEEKILKEPENINDYFAFYFTDSFNYNLDLFKNEKMQIDLETVKNAIKESIKQLNEKDFNSEEELLEKFKTIIAHLNYKNGQVLWPIRVALTNEEFSPGVFELCYAYGYEKTIQHLKNAQIALGQN
jgi:glutamyl-tRNA synthetase